MDLPIEKLETFGLQDFIDDYRFYLCRRTVSPNQVAVALTFDADQCAVIALLPDSFSKCEKLYELIQRRSKVRDFVKALEETGNEHIIKFVHETDFPASSLSASTSANPNPNRTLGLWFNIPQLIHPFYGREDFLTQLHDRLKPRDDSETEVTVLSQVKIVSGLGGIGKTQTARRYIMKRRKFYNNFIWIHAETENLMRNSFLKLAKELEINTKDCEGKPREIQEIVKEIYNKICQGGISNLIVFDNAEDYQSCKKFFPFELHPELTKPVILATSRNQEWISPTGNKIQVLPLDKLTDDESFDFIFKELEIPESDTEDFREESREFIELIGGLPLALQQAVAYVKHQKKVRGLFRRPYKLSDYAKEFKSSSEKLQNFPHAPGSTTVFVTWNLTLEKIKEDETYGKIAIEIIQVMSFLYADKIPIGFLLELLPFTPPPQSWIRKRAGSFRQQQDSQSKDLAEGLELLEKFSMIKITGTFVSIHRQVQCVIIQNLVYSFKVINIANNLIEKCTVALKKMRSATPEAEYADIFLNLYQLLSNRFHFVPQQWTYSQTHILFLDEFGLVLCKVSGGTESLDLEDRVDSESEQQDSWGKLKTHLVCSGVVLLGLNIQ